MDRLHACFWQEDLPYDSSMHVHISVITARHDSLAGSRPSWFKAWVEVPFHSFEL